MNDVTHSGGTVTVAGIDLELFERGTGSPILFLHGAGGVRPDDPFIGLLAQRHRVIAPAHPGFGKSALPDWLDSADDIAHVHLELLDRLGLRQVALIQDRIDAELEPLRSTVGRQIIARYARRIGA